MKKVITAALAATVMVVAAAGYGLANRSTSGILILNKYSQEVCESAEFQDAMTMILGHDTIIQSKPTVSHCLVDDPAHCTEIVDVTPTGERSCIVRYNLQF